MVTLEKEASARVQPAWTRSWPLAIGLVVLIGAAGGIWGASQGSSKAHGGSRLVSPSSLQPWPFTVQSGELRCVNNAVTFTGDGVRYALNGTAQDQGFPPVDAIWAADPSGVGLSVSLQTAITDGLALC